MLWITLAIVFISGYFARRYNGNVAAIDGVILTSNRPNKGLAFIAAAALVLVSGLRNNIGDTGYYIYGFVHSIPYKGEPGFDVFQSLIKELISNDPQVFIFICALITNALIVLVFYKYSAMFELSLFLYITTGNYLVTMNGIRQCLVSAIVFLGTQLIATGKWLPFFILVGLVSTIHTSALIFIPVYFFVRLKPWSKLISITLIAAIVVLLLFDQIGAFLLGTFDGTQYAGYEKSILAAGGGANILRVFVGAVPVILAYLGRKQIEKNNDKFVNILINFSVLNLTFYVLAVQNWIFARMNVYFGLYGLLLLPWLIKKLFDKKTSAIVYGSCVLLYIIFCYFELESYLSYWGIGYRSDFIGL
ncbi:MAG: EpsG family protein [Veillonellales bacterium]